MRNVVVLGTAHRSGPSLSMDIDFLLGHVASHAALADEIDFARSVEL